MNDNDLNEMIKKAQSMIKNNQIPDDIRNLINNFQNSNNNFNNSYNYNNNQNFNSSNQPLSPNNNQNENNNTNSSIPNIDIETLMKIQNIMNKMKNSENDDMSKLLLSLKPYLRDTKKEKIDEYIQLIKMGKLTQLFNTSGGDKK